MGIAYTYCGSMTAHTRHDLWYQHEPCEGWNGQGVVRGGFRSPQLPAGMAEALYAGDATKIRELCRKHDLPGLPEGVTQ